MSSEEVLAEKRRRNAGASARFRDRRKQREREIQDRCRQLEQRTRELEEALRRFEPDNALLQHDDDDMDLPSRARTSMSPPAVSNTGGDRTTLNDRVSQLEHMMDHFRQEKETDAQKLKELEKENVYLKSLLVPVHLAHAGRVVPPSTPPASVVAPSPPHFSSSSATTDEDPLSNKRPRLSSPSL
ncbi:hypothetical protein DFQ28_006056 [Apophysomyces sp. BC1034]|nr:hypothetical protein DFQ30_008893 [Apophysomyces sp. BC1015]KAG0180767.1 hypothetical protein DFQ29_010151 [Apophysomyces sp. BC1021]KAG0187632.1 hypothetical protein DFQ28_006056 [Apophysomyces sp. BC1034]